MSNQINSKQRVEITRIYLSHFLHQINTDYDKNKTKLESLIKIGKDNLVKREIVEELEKLTGTMEMYAIKMYRNYPIEDIKLAIITLENMQIFNVPVIAEFFFFTNDNYQDIKDYIKMLDYLRLLILEYLRSQ